MPTKATTGAAALAADARFWDRSARKYAADPIADPGGYERSLARTAALLTGGPRVLELGCGTGTTALRLAPLVPAYLATDLSAEMIAIARAKLADAPCPSLRFEVGTAESVAADRSLAGGAPEARFDVVLGFNYLHLVPDLDATLATVHGLLEPGGWFVSKTACLLALNPVIRWAIPVMRLFGKAPRVLSFSAEALEAAIGRAGFEVIEAGCHGTQGKDPRRFVVARRR